MITSGRDPDPEKIRIPVASGVARHPPVTSALRAPQRCGEVVTMTDNPVPEVLPGSMMLELVLVPVTDIDRAKVFYAEQLGFTADVDVRPQEGVRIVQLTPPGSYCSITLTEGLPDQRMDPGSLRGLHLVVADIEAARAELIGRGVDVAPVVDLGGVLYAGFEDPDGNTWTLQHMPWRR